METSILKNDNKVLIGFKCNPSLKSALCEQAEKLGVTLSSHVETIMLTHENKQDEIKKLSEQLEILNNKIAFYENVSLKKLFDQNKGKTISLKNQDGEKINVTINDIQDVFTVIINSFQIQK